MGMLAALAASLGLAGQDSADQGTAALEAATSRSSAAALVAQPANTEGRLLASNCFQCHGTMGNGGFEQIRGKSANELIEFQGKTASRDIMAAHAQGYTTDQLRKIAAYLK
jgi:mono/diheme cytochrome c family protein